MVRRPFPVLSLSVAVSHASALVPEARLRFLARRTLTAARHSRPVALSIAFVDRRQSMMFNQQYRRRNRPTDILSFPFDTARTSAQHNQELSGEIILCSPVIREEAQRDHVPLQCFTERLFVHGVLHVLGFNHETEGDFHTMQGVEVAVLGDWIL